MADRGGRDEPVIEGVLLGEDGYPLFMDGASLEGATPARLDPPQGGGFYRSALVRTTPRPSREEGWDAVIGATFTDHATVRDRRRSGGMVRPSRRYGPRG